MIFLYLIAELTEANPVWKAIGDYGVSVGIVILFLMGGSLWFIRHQLEEWKEARDHKREERAEERRHRQKLNDLEIMQREVYIEREQTLTSTLAQNSEEMKTIANDQKEMLALVIRNYQVSENISDRLEVVEDKINNSVKSSMDSWTDDDLDDRGPFVT